MTEFRNRSIPVSATGSSLLLLLSALLYLAPPVAGQIRTTQRKADIVVTPDSVSLTPGSSVQVVLAGTLARQVTAVTIRNLSTAGATTQITARLGGISGTGMSISIQARTGASGGDYGLSLTLPDGPHVVPATVFKISIPFQIATPPTRPGQTPTGTVAADTAGQAEMRRLVAEAARLRAANTFEKTVWPVFRSDRCMNCHVFDHAGGKRDQPPHSDPEIARHYPYDCTDCHSGSEIGVRIWISPDGAGNSQANWTRSMGPAALCRQILPEGLGTVHELASHLKTDDRIRWAIENRRTPDGIVRAPGPVTSMAAFADLVDRWSNLGKFTCG